MTEHLTLEDLLVAAEAVLGHAADVRDYGLLEAAIARASATVYGDDAYPDLNAKAAALLHSIVRNHALVDGNKRLGWIAVRLFCILNGVDLRAPEDEAFELVIAVADGSVSDVSAIAAALAGWAVPIDPPVSAT